MIKKVIDNRVLSPTRLCDAVVELDTRLNLTNKVIEYFQAYDLDQILLMANNLKEDVIVYIYDLNSKPLK